MGTVNDFRSKARKAVAAFAIVSGLTLGAAGITNAQVTGPITNAPVQVDEDTAVQNGEQTQVGVNDNDAVNTGSNNSTTEQTQTGGDQTNGDDTATASNELGSSASTNVGGGDGKTKAGDSAAHSSIGDTNQAAVANANDSNTQELDQSATTEQAIVLDNDAEVNNDAELNQEANQGATQEANQEITQTTDVLIEAIIGAIADALGL